MKKILLTTAERSSKVTPAVDFIPSKFWSLPQRVSKTALHTALNAYRESLGDSRFVNKFLLVFYKCSQTRYISCTNLIFPVSLMCPVPIQNHMQWWWIEIKENPK